MSKVLVELVYETCCSCGTPFGVEVNLHRERIKGKGETFYCPNGHAQSYTESDLQKLQKELKKQKADATRYKDWYNEVCDEKEKMRRSVSALRGVVTRTKNRIAQGVCPCCDEYFPNLHAHMTASHPDYESQQEGENE